MFKKFAFITIPSVLIGTSCSQLPGTAISKTETVVASSTSKNADDAKEDGSSKVQDNDVKAAEQPPTQPLAAEQTSIQPSKVTADCGNASALKRETLSITVAENRPSSGGNKCPFGMADNAPKTDGKYAARLEFKHSINIPSDRKLCGIDPSAAPQSIKYDDHMFVNLNNFVLLASRGIPTEFDLDASGFRKFDWSKLVATDRSSNTKCGAGVTCMIPATETTGNVSFTLSEEARNKLLNTIADKPLEFSVVLTGDNDENSDCLLQNNLTLTFNYSYVPK
jgi:hypothetical protein